MNAANVYEPLNLRRQFLENIKFKTDQNNNEVKSNNYENLNINPSFRYYKDDRNISLIPNFIPKIIYKNKSLFHSEKPSQTEQDEIGVNQAYLNKHFGYTNYGNFNVANQSLPEANKHKTILKNNLFELV
jgi:hypothetical protein